MAVTLTKTQHDNISKILNDTKAASAKDNKALNKAKLDEIKSSLKEAGIDVMDTNNAATKNIREDFKMLTSLSPESLAATSNKDPNKFTNSFWEGAMNDLISQVDGAGIVDAQGITTGAGDGSQDGVLTDPSTKIGKLFADNQSGGNVTKTATDAYQKVLTDPTATAAQIGAAQRDVQLAFQVQYPEASVDQLKDYLNGSSKVIEQANPGRYQEVSASIGQSQLADDVSKKNVQTYGDSLLNPGAY